MRERRGRPNEMFESPQGRPDVRVVLRHELDRAHRVFRARAVGGQRLDEHVRIDALVGEARLAQLFHKRGELLAFLLEGVGHLAVDRQAHHRSAARMGERRHLVEPVGQRRRIEDERRPRSGLHRLGHHRRVRRVDHDAAGGVLPDERDHPEHRRELLPSADRRVDVEIFRARVRLRLNQADHRRLVVRRNASMVLGIELLSFSPIKIMFLPS